MLAQNYVQNPITEDIELGTYGIRTSTSQIIDYLSLHFGVRNLANTNWAAWNCGIVKPLGISFSWQTAVNFDIRNKTGAKCDFRTNYGGTQICASLESQGSNDGVFKIPRCGPIRTYGVYEDRLDWSDGVLRIPDYTPTTPLIGDIYLDATNHRLYVRSGQGVWKYAELI